ncbi:hypothetical protein [Cupriavidus basilensis]
MPSTSTYVQISRQPRPRADEAQAVVTAAGLFWSVTGEFTTPALGQTPKFVASDVRLVNADGSETTEMLDNLHPDFVAHLEEQAAESMVEERADARATVKQPYRMQHMCDLINAARSVA